MVGFPIISAFSIPLCLVILGCKIINLLSTMNFRTFSSLHLKTVDLASFYSFSILVLLLFTFSEISVFWCAFVAFWCIHHTEWTRIIYYISNLSSKSIYYYFPMFITSYFSFLYYSLLNFLTYKYYYLLTIKKIYS